MWWVMRDVMSKQSVKMRLFFIIASVVVQADILVAAQADIIFNAADSSSQLMGFGAQIWSGDTRIESILTSLHIKYVRMKFGGSWSPPTDATQARMDAYVVSKEEWYSVYTLEESQKMQSNALVFGIHSST
jgi:hypothetical protein